MIHPREGEESFQKNQKVDNTKRGLFTFVKIFTHPSVPFSQGNGRLRGESSDGAAGRSIKHGPSRHSNDRGLQMTGLIFLLAFGVSFL